MLSFIVYNFNGYLPKLWSYITNFTAFWSLRKKKEPCHKHESDNDLVVLNSCSTFMCEV